MITLQKIVYRSGIRIFGFLIRLAAIRSNKAKRWISGRVDLLRTLEEDFSKLGHDRYWIHCASHGEFEQAKPIIIEIRSRKPSAVILVSMFSPSGMKHAENFDFVDRAFYLPLDTKSNARKIVTIIKPKVALWIKYELWPHILESILDQNIPIYLVSAKFHSSHIVLRNRGAWISSILKRFTGIWTQDIESSQILQKAGINNRFNGDTRIDQALAVTKSIDATDNWVKEIYNRRSILVFGSIWPSDWQIIEPVLSTLKASYHLIIAPHEIDDSFIETISKEFQNNEVSLYTSGPSEESQHMIINTIGRLAILFRYADLAYIGGGFGEGLHNVLEPAAYGKGVLVGEEIEQFPEAQKLIALGAAKQISNSTELLKEIKHLLQENTKVRSAQALSAFFQNSAGASKRIVDEIMS